MDNSGFPADRPAMGMLAITRYGGRIMARARKFRVYVNGYEAAEIRWGETVSIPVAPGQVTVEARLDQLGSPLVGVAVAPGETAELFVRMHRAPWKAFSWNPSKQLRWSRAPDADPLPAVPGWRPSAGRWAAGIGVGIALILFVAYCILTIVT